MIKVQKYEVLVMAQEDGISALHRAIGGVIEAKRCLGELGIEASEMAFILGYLRNKISMVNDIVPERMIV